MELPAIDALALLGVVTAETNQFRREQMKDQLLAEMKPLTNNFPSESKWLLGNNLSKSISLLNCTSPVLIKTTVSS